MTNGHFWRMTRNMTRDDTSAEPTARGDRIAKVMARAGLCSRRDAERWIADGRVTLNGTRLETPAVTVTDRDDIRVDGKPLPKIEPVRIWRYHKPSGLVTSNRDEKGRATVFDKLPADLPRVLSIGRLDINTEGLLLLTNDGETARRLELPSTGWLRRYRVRAHGSIEQAALDAIADGVEIDGVRYGPVDATFERKQGSNTWLRVAIREGKNREVKNILDHLGLKVTRLIRISYGPFQLGDLKPGEVKELPARVIRDQLGGSPKDPSASGKGERSGKPNRPKRPDNRKRNPEKQRADRRRNP